MLYQTTLSRIGTGLWAAPGWDKPKAGLDVRRHGRGTNRVIKCSTAAAGSITKVNYRQADPDSSFNPAELYV